MGKGCVLILLLNWPATISYEKIPHGLHLVWGLAACGWEQNGSNDIHTWGTPDVLQQINTLRKYLHLLFFLLKLQAVPLPLLN